YIDAVATNDNISTLKLEEVSEKTISTSTNLHILAHYELKYYIEAEKFIIKYYKINISSFLNDSLFFSSNSSTSN
ncbi:23023_t:CDS:2, partial [Gigaspora margarita]